jgi:hypothetical protein
MKMAVSLTPNYSLRKHDAGDLNWDVDMNWNLTKVDSELKAAENHRDLTSANPHGTTATQVGAVPLLAGITANRPAAPVLGMMYFDTDEGKPIWYDGADWVDATGTIV